MWVLKVRLRSSGLAAILLPTKPPFLPYTCFFKGRHMHKQLIFCLFQQPSQRPYAAWSLSIHCKGNVDVTVLGKPSFSVISFYWMLRSKLHSMNKKHYWGWLDLPFRRLRTTWQFMWKKNEWETKMFWGRWLWNCYNAFILFRVARWLYSYFSFCGTFWSYLLIYYLFLLSKFTSPEIKNTFIFSPL